MMETIGRYQLVEEIGRGGMSTVYLARDTALERKVALKLMPHQMALDKSMVARFQREAKIIANLDHPHIVSIYDVGTKTDTGQPYLVMRLLKGGTLRDFLATSPAVEMLNQVFKQVASALDIAHENGIVHRDIKPTNILFDNHQQAFLTDFGIAKLSDAATRLTGKALIGTPAYMSPELCKGENTQITGLSDQYSFAIVVYEALAGELPFVGDTIRVMYQHMHTPPPRITKKRTDLPPLVADVLIKALSKEPEARYPTTLAFVSALEGALVTSGIMFVPQELEQEEPEEGTWEDTVMVPTPESTPRVKPKPSPTAKGKKQNTPVSSAPRSGEKVIPPIERDYQNGLKALNEQDWAQATVLFTEVIRRDPRYKDALAQRRKAQNAQRREERPSIPERSAASSSSGKTNDALRRRKRTTGNVAEKRIRRTTQNISRGAGGTEEVSAPERSRRVLWMGLGVILVLLFLLGVSYGVGFWETVDDSVGGNTTMVEDNNLDIPEQEIASTEPQLEETRSLPTNTPLPPADLSDDVQIYGAEYEVGANNNITLQEGQLVVESKGAPVTVSNPYGEQARLLSAGVMGIAYTLEPLSFETHCFVGECYVEGSVDGEQPLQANEAVAVGASGRPGNVFSARNEDFVSMAAVVPVPTATARPRPTNTAVPRATATQTPIATVPPRPTNTVEVIADSDGDGVPDNEDNCPTIAGGNAEDNPGCPFSKEQTESGIGGTESNSGGSAGCVDDPNTLQNECE